MRFLIILFYFSLNLAYALDLSSTSNTKYEILGSYFVTAQRPSFEDVKGWWSGRCFRKNKPQTAIGSLLILSPSTGQYQPDPDHPAPGTDGPLFPHAMMNEYNMMVFEVPGASADYVDFPSKGLIKSLEEDLNSARFNQFKATSTENSIVSKNEPSNALMSVRKYENYLLAQVATLQSNSDSAAGDVFSNCYYFKRLR
jgi:hypothetical protein